VHSYLLGFAFAVLGACLLTVLVSGIVLFFLNWRRINEAFAHPMLKQRAFQHQPFSIQAAITLDYFFRMIFTGSKRPGLIGNANRLLAHVDPKTLPLGVRWPVAGFWGGCFLGIIAMVVVWAFVLLGI